MAHGYPTAPLGNPALQLPSFWAAQPHPQPQHPTWEWPDCSSSASPASSPDSCGLSPSPCPWSSAGLGARKGGAGGAGSNCSGRRARLGLGQRQSASQREKHRMRRLAQALHTLRLYLPASVAPAGQSLTKIETLRLASRYIAHLSEQLGLSEEALVRAARRPPTAPDPLAWSRGLQQDPIDASCCCRSPASPSAPWLLGSPSCSGSGAPAESSTDGGGRTESPWTAELAELDLSSQILPDELVAFLEGFLPPASQG
ncbi:mesoderm posterior protein 1-like [Podarcis raffonei]|uniref:mesoderm posterior protein 1-like n=1 Tax=Podarcis raffonei TaxID=65483 RepID=UPI002329651A|nr:mesoderm posterior protein 1-like [Podarcis raffonei]